MLLCALSRSRAASPLWAAVPPPPGLLWWWLRVERQSTTHRMGYHSGPSHVRKLTVVWQSVMNICNIILYLSPHPFQVNLSRQHPSTTPTRCRSTTRLALPTACSMGASGTPLPSQRAQYTHSRQRSTPRSPSTKCISLPLVPVIRRMGPQASQCTTVSMGRCLGQWPLDVTLLLQTA